MIEVEDELGPIYPSEGARGVVKSMVESAAFNGRYLKERNPDIKVIGVEPAQRQHKLSGLKRVTGLPDEHFPSILDRDVVDEYLSVTDDEAFAAGIRIARTDGILVGPTTGAVLHAAMEWSNAHAGTAVVISGDNAAKYLSAYAAYL